MDGPNLAGYIVLGYDPASGKYVGYVENSFSMSISVHRTQFHWSGTGYSNFGGTVPGIDGAQDADTEIRKLREKHPEYNWQKYDVHSEDIPVSIDWDDWRRGSARSIHTMSGVVDKHVARNPKFTIKEVGQMDARGAGKAALKLEREAATDMKADMYGENGNG